MMRIAEAQEPTSPPVDFSHVTVTVVVVVTAVALAITFYSIYAHNCSHAAAFAGGEGSSRVGRARRAVERGGSDIIHPPVIVDDFPKLTFSELKGLRLAKGALECAVCLGEFEDNDMLRLVPRCSHVFHSECIDEWLRFHSTCPVCRAELAPQPGKSARKIIRLVGTVCTDESTAQVMVEDNRNRDVERGEE